VHVSQGGAAEDLDRAFSAAFLPARGRNERDDRRTQAFRIDVARRAAEIAAAPDLEDRLAAKREARTRDEAAKPLAAYREEELSHMRRNFYGFDPSYHVARHHFVRKSPASWTPRHLARHRDLGWKVPA
jgi:putative two-component system hydrogenase maturation factor HypX/HoxX